MMETEFARPLHREAHFPPPYCVPGEVTSEEFAKIRNALVLNFCKWDPQVGDVSTLSRFPLVLMQTQWQILSCWAEQLSQEIVDAEEECTRKPHLLSLLGLPRKLRLVLESLQKRPASPAAVRAMRFDFHFTTEGWRISEVNSDVPGGFSEASAFTEAMAHHFKEYYPSGDPAGEWAQAVATEAQCGTVALLSAPGFMEDHQVVAYLAQKLRSLGCKTHLVNPTQILWNDGSARLSTSWSQNRLDAIVRFFQAEWMPRLLGGHSWNEYFVGGKTPIANPGISAISESKRFPLIWDHLSCSMKTWRSLLPETRDPREVNWRKDDHWILKTAFSNTGDTVSHREFMPEREWNKVCRDVRFFPRNWLAQRRFEPIALQTPIGRLYPCLGVYTINGKAAGIYGRLGTRPLVDFSAIDVAVLLDRRN